ncbi:MAG: hypothetical protein RLZ35_308 [Pseudomonadota bacterium]|jgi:type IV pilus assembly protein PilA
MLNRIDKFDIQKGFSIVELMIVACIIGVLASISLSAYNEHMIRSRVAKMIPVFESAQKLEICAKKLSNMLLKR